MSKKKIFLALGAVIFFVFVLIGVTASSPSTSPDQVKSESTVEPKAEEKVQDVSSESVESLSPAPSLVLSTSTPSPSPTLKPTPIPTPTAKQLLVQMVHT
ncbi:MAG: hypothetical protein NUV69_01865 [Candidatus Curtissbacteria bacterium]|nr:hypothetical protein [Candidatus Curtissbacteria bacterium]